jgi:uncharacterized protein YlzI (FlbEa/FlbD family)
VPEVADEPQTQIWLVNGEKLTVDGTPEQVVSALDVSAGPGALTKMANGGTLVYINPNHVTHIRGTPGARVG